MRTLIKKMKKLTIDSKDLKELIKTNKFKKRSKSKKAKMKWKI